MCNAKIIFIYILDVLFCFLLQAYTCWKDIADVIRNRVFKEDEQHLIDIFDIQVFLIFDLDTTPLHEINSKKNFEMKSYLYENRCKV